MSDEIGNSRYTIFVNALKMCEEMASTYLRRCIIDNRVQTSDLYYFKNLFALKVNKYTNEAKILGSTSDPDCPNESTKSYNIRYLDIDKDLFNKDPEEFDKENIDKSIFVLVDMLTREEKIKLYDVLKGIIDEE